MGSPLATAHRPVTPAVSLADFTTDEEPVLIESNLAGGAGVGAVLPRRPTAIGVLSKYDTSDATQAWPYNVARVADALRDALRIDLSRFPEHLGAIHLCFANPLLRRFERSVTADMARSALRRSDPEAGAERGSTARSDLCLRQSDPMS